MEFTHDPEAGAAYLKLNDSAVHVDRTEVLQLAEGDLNVDLDADGRILGIEFLPAEALLGSATVDALLAKFPSQ